MPQCSLHPTAPAVSSIALVGTDSHGIVVATLSQALLCEECHNRAAAIAPEAYTLLLHTIATHEPDPVIILNPKGGE